MIASLSTPAGLAPTKSLGSALSSPVGGAIGRPVGRPVAPLAIPIEGLSRPVIAKIATERSEFEQAFEIVARRYQDRGYEEASSKPFRFTPYHALPGTTTFVAKQRDEVVATMTLVPDNPHLGLPMEAIYGEEVARLRREGHRVGEVTSLAEGGLESREFLRVFPVLIKLMMQYHVRHGGDSWAITVNPRHAGYYRKTLGFESLGPRRSYDLVQGHPAEAYLLDVPMMRANAPAAYWQMLGEDLPEAVLAAPRRTAAHARYFGARSTQVDAETVADLIRRIERPGSEPRRAPLVAGRGAA